jgi:hypothetical protein
MVESIQSICSQCVAAIGSIPVWMLLTSLLSTAVGFITLVGLKTCQLILLSLTYTHR